MPIMFQFTLIIIHEHYSDLTNNLTFSFPITQINRSIMLGSGVNLHKRA